MRKSLALLASAALMGLTLAAHADTFTYTESGITAYPNFTFTSTVLLTSTTNLLTSPTISNLTCTLLGKNCTALSVTFGANDYLSFANGSASGSITGIDGSFFQVGYHNLGYTALTVTDIPGAPAVAATPEPSSLFLLGTGVLGLAGAARRKFLKA